MNLRVGPEIDLGQRGGTVSGILAVLIGIGLTFFGFTAFQSQNQALDDPVETSAQVVETGIEEDSSRRGGIDFTPLIRYSYSFEGSNYTSSNMYPGGQGPESYSLESNAREAVQNYSQGSTIQVYVPPEKPEQAFIKPRKTDDPWIMMGLGFLFSAAGAYQLLGGLH